MGHDPVHGPEREILVLIREGEEGHVDDFSHEDPLGAAFLFPVGDVGAAATPAGDPQGLDPRPGRVDSRRDGCVRRGRDLVRWARAWFGAVIDLVVSQVCKERCRRWGQERACRAHLSELARAVRSDRTGAFSPSPLTPHRVGRWEVDRMAARRTTESRGFVLEPRCLALVSRWGMEEHAGRGGGGCWAAWTYHVGSQVQRVAKTPPSRTSQ